MLTVLGGTVEAHQIWCVLNTISKSLALMNEPFPLTGCDFFEMCIDFLVQSKFSISRAVDKHEPSLTLRVALKHIGAV